MSIVRTTLSRCQAALRHLPHMVRHNPSSLRVAAVAAPRLFNLVGRASSTLTPFFFKAERQRRAPSFKPSRNSHFPLTSPQFFPAKNVQKLTKETIQRIATEHHSVRSAAYALVKEAKPRPTILPRTDGGVVSPSFTFNLLQP